MLRLAGLLHDIGKPSTCASPTACHSIITVVGARMAEHRLRESPDRTDRGGRHRLVELHLRFHGYGVDDGSRRRYVRDAGPLLDKLNQLTRADVTTRDPSGRLRRALQDELEERIARLSRRTWRRCGRHWTAGR